MRRFKMTDYRNMTLREELEARFEEYEEKQREKDEYNNYYGVVNQNTPSYSLNFEKNLTSKREDGNGINSYVNNSASASYQSVYDQIKGSLSDMTKEYFLMHSHNFKNLDDYYHCKANYNAARRGPVGNMIATIGGNEKEAFDYFKNRLRGVIGSTSSARLLARSGS